MLPTLCLRSRSQLNNPTPWLDFAGTLPPFDSIGVTDKTLLVLPQINVRSISSTLVEAAHLFSVFAV
jgi:hypothetical protein